MLYDAKRAGIYSVDNFVEWLGKQPASKTYDYCSPRYCAAAQYLEAHGIEDYMLSPDELRALGWHEIVFHPWAETFGRAHRRGQIVQLSGWRKWIAKRFGIIRPRAA